MLGPYEILAPIGEGGMGEVYRARDTKLSRDVAIKVLPDDLAGDEERRARFEREAKLLAAVSHPAVATVFGVDEVDGQAFLAMELIEGDTLADHIARGALRAAAARRLFIQIAAGLEAAHTSGVVHRDLKPANVIVTPEGNVKIVDFGLAKPMGDAPSADGLSQSPTLTKETAVGTILGTAAYMSPEQARAESVDAQTDIWAFGCCLYEALTGRRAFEGKTIADVLAGIIHRELDDSLLPVETPSSMRKLIRRCTRKERQSRLRHIGDARLELEDMDETPSVEDSLPSTPNRRGWISGLLVGAALSAALVVGLGRLGSKNVATENTEGALPYQMTANPGENPVVSTAISPDGQYLAYVDGTGLFLRLTANGETHQVRTPEGFEIARVNWFPDGTNLLLSAVVDNATGLWKMPILGGDPRKLAQGADLAVVSPDGDVAFLSARLGGAEIHVMGPNGEGSRVLVTGDEYDSFWELAWSPNSSRLLVGVMRRAPDGRTDAIESVAIESGERTVVVTGTRLFQSWRGVLPFVLTPDGRLVYVLRELPPNDGSSNLWSVALDSETWTLDGTPTRLTRLSGYNFKNLTVTSDGQRISFLRETNQADVYVGEIDASGLLVDGARRLTLDDRNDYPTGWLTDRPALLFDSRRGDRWGVYVQGLDDANASHLMIGLEERGESELAADGRFVLLRDGASDAGSGALRRIPVDGGPPESLEASGADFHCVVGVRCVLGNPEPATNEYVFHELGPKGRVGDELARIEDRRPFTNWDLSPDGQWVVVVHNNDSMRRVSLRDGSSVEIESADFYFGETVSFGHDGRGVYVDGYRYSEARGRRARKDLLYVSLDTEPIVSVVNHEPNGWHVYPVPSPDGRYLAFALMRFAGNAWTLDGF